METSRRHTQRMPALARPRCALYGVATLYFETDNADGFCEPGFSKERRLEPHITAGLSFILGDKIPIVPYLIGKWHRDNPDRPHRIGSC